MITEDLQHFVAGDARARAYALHKSERSFLSVELASGRVVPGHPMWSYLTERCRVSKVVLRRIIALAEPPDFVGWNYYSNSERYLATGTDGTFSNRPLFDCRPSTLDPKPLLRAAAARLGLPFVLSKVHVHGSDMDRASWLAERHADVVTLRAEGVDIRAFGAWAAFGLVDWNSLLRASAGKIEDGLYTCSPRGGDPELTLAGEVFRALRTGTRTPHVICGWCARERIA